jgi:hypothetical protein
MARLHSRQVEAFGASNLRVEFRSERFHIFRTYIHNYAGRETKEIKKKREAEKQRRMTTRRRTRAIKIK